VPFSLAQYKELLADLWQKRSALDAAIDGLSAAIKSGAIVDPVISTERADQEQGSRFSEASSDTGMSLEGEESRG
jgi:hypothetical protein